MELGEKIIRLRKEKGMSQEILADKLGVSRQAVSKWEQGVSFPDTANVIAISAMFGVSTDFILKNEIEDKEADFAREKACDISQKIENKINTVKEEKKIFLAAVFLFFLELISMGYSYYWFKFSVVGDFYEFLVQPVVILNIAFVIFLGIFIFAKKLSENGKNAFGKEMLAVVTGVFGVSKILGILFEYFNLKSGKNFADLVFYVARPIYAFECVLSIITLGICIFFAVRHFIEIPQKESVKDNLPEKI